LIVPAFLASALSLDVVRVVPLENLRNYSGCIAVIKGGKMVKREIKREAGKATRPREAKKEPVYNSVLNWT
jgi:hypothetical protein